MQCMNYTTTLYKYPSCAKHISFLTKSLFLVKLHDSDLLQVYVVIISPTSYYVVLDNTTQDSNIVVIKLSVQVFF